MGLELEAGVVGAEVDAHETHPAASLPGAEGREPGCGWRAVAGVDGVPGGWVVARVAGGQVTWSVVGSAADVLAATGGCAAVGVDIPLGLPTGAAPRACDVACARRLGRARSSVFPAPPRPVLAATDAARRRSPSRAG